MNFDPNTTCFITFHCTSLRYLLCVSNLKESGVFLWARVPFSCEQTHADKAVFVEVAVKLWQTPRSLLTPTFKNVRSLICTPDLGDRPDLLKALYMPRKKGEGQRSEQSISLRSGPCIFVGTISDVHLASFSKSTSLLQAHPAVITVPSLF